MSAKNILFWRNVTLSDMNLLMFNICDIGYNNVMTMTDMQIWLFGKNYEPIYSFNQDFSYKNNLIVVELFDVVSFKYNDCVD